MKRYTDENLKSKQIPQFLFLFSCLLLTSTPSSAQEELVPLRQNAAIISHLKNQPQTENSYKKKRDTLISLPFIDDFSSSIIYPDRKKWADRTVYINNSFGINPPSFGVATFDGLNSKGHPYNENGLNASRSCDTLTSLPIDLSGLSLDDNVYLSFYWQQKGYGDNPEPNDSFMLEFKPEDSEKKWQTVWKTNGMVDSFENYPFNYQMILLDTTTGFNYYYSGFQFRFRAIGNRTGSLDHWNLDYVILNKDRSLNDSFPNDFAVFQKPKGLTKIYTSLPWDHFISRFNTFLAKDVEFNLFNNWDRTLTPIMYYEVRDSTHDVDLESSFSLGETPTYQSLFRSERKQALNLPVLSIDGKDNEKLVLQLKVRAIPNLSNDRLNSNDVYTHNQRFYNYFAYDDGTAERGYGLQNVRSGSVALGFEASFADTLKYVAFHFTGGYEPLPIGQKFNLKIWKNLAPTEEVLHQMNGLTPVYTDVIQGWFAYKLDTPLVITGKFYIGWEQFRPFNLNVGLDANYQYFNNNEPNPNFFFNASGKWENSKVQGTPMIRPVFGDDIHLKNRTVKTLENKLQIYPNPAKDFIIAKLAKASILYLYNAQGQIVWSSQTKAEEIRIQVSNLPRGIYIIKTSEGHYKKLVLN